jgi:site-specific DNA-cytosine methylase
MQVPVSAQASQAIEIEDDDTVTILDTFSGTGGTVDAAREVTLKTSIKTKVVMACESDEQMRESIVRRHNIPCHDDMATINNIKIPTASMLVTTPPCQDWSIAGYALGPAGSHSQTIPQAQEALLV